MFSFFLQFFFFFRRVAGNPFGGSQSAVLVLPHHLTIFLELGYFLSFGKNMIQIQLKNLVIFMLSPNKKIEMANPFQLLVFLVIPILKVYKIDVGHIHIEGGVSTLIFFLFKYTMHVFRLSPRQESVLFSQMK